LPRVLLTLAPSALLWHAAPAAQDSVDVQAFVSDSCIVADEPYFFPAAASQVSPDGTTQRFLPLLGLVVGKIAELYINHKIEGAAEKIKAAAVRKDTRYASIKQMNFYRAEFEPAPTIHINARLGCMTIVAATLKPAGTDCTAAYVPKALAPESEGKPQSEWKTSRQDDSVENQLRRANICVDGTARAVYEGRFEFSTDATAYRLKDAGYRINSLLTTQEKGASRSALYTLKISEPGPTDQPVTISTAWVSLGTVTAGAHSTGSGGDSAPWLRVPPLSAEARRTYEQQTKVQQEVMGEINALKRALQRNQRMLAGLDPRIAAASPAVAAGLTKEKTQIEVQIEAQGAELDARNAEYQDLPRAPLEYMPVTIEVAVTETESEKKARVVIADFIHDNSDMVGSAVGNSVSDVLSKSVNSADLITEPDGSSDATDLEQARSQYYDALVASRTGAPGTDAAEAARKLAQATDRYNHVRGSLGLEPVK
ncbi:MAG TPA: hypothetical protein VF848_07780, partial [Steroidobacteraceae bacterium]